MEGRWSRGLPGGTREEATNSTSCKSDESASCRRQTGEVGKGTRHTDSVQVISLEPPETALYALLDYIRLECMILGDGAVLAYFGDDLVGRPWELGREQ